jgi:hypothetical protein
MWFSPGTLVYATKAGLIQTTIHVTIDDVFKKYTRYFLNNK